MTVALEKDAQPGPGTQPRREGENKGNDIQPRTRPAQEGETKDNDFQLRRLPA